MERISSIAAVAPSKPSQSLAKPVSTSRLDGLKLALTKFGLLRGEVVDAIRLESYSKALAEFPDDQDTLEVLKVLATRRRAEFEPKIPELGDLLEMVRERLREKRRLEREARERALAEAEEQHRREHPEAYTTWAEIMAEYKARKEHKSEQAE